MAASVTLTDFTIGGDGSVTITYADGSGFLFASLQDLRDSLQDVDSADMAKKFLHAWFLARQPDASNVNIVEGKTLTLDLSNANPIRVQ
jgi:hypothetical protein